MSQVLAAVVSEGLEPVLVAVELALESGNISGDHVLNVLARLQSPVVQLKPVETSLTLTEEPRANVDRYDHLRAQAPQEVNDVE
jgi:hypothetical protein